MNNNYQVVSNENIYDTIWNNLYQTNNYVVLVFYSFGYFNLETNKCLYLDWVLSGPSPAGDGSAATLLVAKMTGHQTNNSW